MNIVLSRSAVVEFGVYEENAIIVLGFKFKTGEPIRSLILQMEEPTSNLAQDKWGMHVEIDEKGFYGGVSDFRYDESAECIQLALKPEKSKGISAIQVEIPHGRSSNEQQLIQKLAEAYKYSLG
jgi:hypothetical protein